MSRVLFVVNILTSVSSDASNLVLTLVYKFNQALRLKNKIKIQKIFT